MDAALSRLAGSAEQMGLPKEDGATSTTAWLANLTGLTKGDASRLVAMARVTTEHTEASRAAWAAGDISTEQARVIMEAINALPDWCGDEERGDAEAHLLSLAGRFTLDDLKRLANRVLEVIDPDGADEVLGEKLREQEKKAWAATRFSARRRGNGLTRGVFDIPDADYDTLAAALEGIIAPRRWNRNAAREGMDLDEYKNLSRDQKMGHAFVELIEHFPENALPQAGGLAATVAVTIGVNDLTGGHGAATNSSGTTVSAQKAQRMACNAHLVAVYLDSASRVIDHGMTRRIYDRHQRLVLALRDQGCIFPACDRPPSWCEAHHINYWSEEGPTDLDNAALLCHFHHFLVHEGEWGAVMAPDGVPEIIPPRRVDPRQRPRRHGRFTKQQPRAA
jgi:hypothetical protein